METNAVLKNLVYTFLTNAFAKVNKVARIARKLKLKERFSAKVLHVRIAHPLLSQGFIAQIEKIFQYQATDHQTDGLHVYPSRSTNEQTPFQNTTSLFGLTAEPTRGSYQ